MTANDCQLLSIALSYCQFFYPAVGTEVSPDTAIRANCKPNYVSTERHAPAPVQVKKTLTHCLTSPQGVPGQTREPGAIRSLTWSRTVTPRECQQTDEPKSACIRGTLPAPPNSPTRQQVIETVLPNASSVESNQACHQATTSYPARSLGGQPPTSTSHEQLLLHFH